MKTLQTAGWRTGAFGKVHATEDNRTGEWHDWIEREHPEHYDAMLATPANWNAQLPYYSAYGEKKVNLTERMRRAKEEMAWSEGG